MQRLRLLFLLIIFSEMVHSQTFTYYPWNSTFSVASNPNRAIWVDFRFQMNSYFSSLSTEISPMINLNRADNYKFYIGGGARFNFLNYLQENTTNTNPLEGYFLNVGVRAVPVAKLPRLQIAFDLSPYAGKNFDIGLFRANLGLGYVLGK